MKKLNKHINEVIRNLQFLRGIPLRELRRLVENEMIKQIRQSKEEEYKNKNKK